MPESLPPIDGILDAPPRYLVLTLGPAPGGGPAREAWMRAAAGIEEYRARFGVSHPCQAFGVGALPGGTEGSAMRVRVWELIIDARRSTHPATAAQLATG